MKFLAKMYEGLGTNRSQRFWRAFLILCLISAVLIIGFYTHAIDLVFAFGAKGE